MYNSPVLYDQSETIKEKLSFNDKRKKHLIIYDQKAAGDVKQALTAHSQEELDYEPFEIEDAIKLQDLRTLLYSQKMGTHLYIASNWDHAATVFAEATEAGFTEDEIQTVIYGPKRRYIYCMKCYHTSEISDGDEAQCARCDAYMEVGPFFSKVRKGYIGYPFIPN